MFYETEFDEELSNWNVSPDTDMFYMFYNTMKNYKKPHWYKET
jgi:hypothetical protein